MPAKAASWAMERSENGSQCQKHNSGIEHTFSGWTVGYVNCVSVKLLKIDKHALPVAALSALCDMGVATSAQLEVRGHSLWLQ